MSVFRAFLLKVMVCCSLAASANPGDLDPTFGNGGVTVLSLGFDREGPSTLLLQADGKAVVLRFSTDNGALGFNPRTQVTLLRYTANGALDPSYGTGGLVVLPFGDAAAPQPDGKTVVVGTPVANRTTDVERFNIDGSADASIAVLKLPADFQVASALVQSDGKLLVSGLEPASTSGSQVAVLSRYTTNGQIDVGFGHQGSLTSSNLRGFQHIALDSEQRIVVAGGFSVSGFLARYNTNGTLDATFGQGGVVATPQPAGGGPFALALSSDGSVTVAVPVLNGPAGFFVARYLHNGAPDVSFANDGLTTITFPEFAATSTFVSNIQRLGDGRLLIASTIQNGSPSCGAIRGVVLRLNVDGSLDTAYGSGTGKGVIPSTCNSSADLMVAQPDGKAIIASGNAIARLQSGDTWDVVEYYYPALDHYFISSLQADIQALDNNQFPGWVRTGHSFKAFLITTAGTEPVCRFYLPPPFGDSHFYSASPDECAAVHQQHPGFDYETPNTMYIALPNPVTGACAPSQVPVYRLWDKRVDTNHRYTTDIAVRDQMLALGWVLEGYGAASPNLVIMCAPVS